MVDHLYECPLCHAHDYSRVAYAHADCSVHLSSFFKCSGCDFAFTRPQLFPRTRQSSPDHASRPAARRMRRRRDLRAARGGIRPPVDS